MSQPEPALTYEAARDELADIVRRLEAGGEPLATSLSLWERAEELANIAQTHLDGARKLLTEKTQVQGN